MRETRKTRPWVEFSFDSAHFLPNVPDGHKCKRMHGHTYRLRVTMEGPVDATLGWVIDYAMVKASVDPLVNTLDHQVLNRIEGLEIPTCEVIAHWLADRIEITNFGQHVRAVEIELRETERAGVIVCL